MKKIMMMMLLSANIANAQVPPILQAGTHGVLVAMTNATASVSKKNYPAKDLKIGTVIEIMKDIQFISHSSMTFIYKGNSVSSIGEEESLDSHCSLSDYGIHNYDYDTGVNKPLKKGEFYTVDNVDYNDVLSKGRVQISFRSSTRKFLVLDCEKAATWLTKLSNETGVDVSMDNLTYIKINTVKEILKGLIKIKD